LFELKNNVKRRYENMGQLGQQLQVNVPAGTGQVIVTGLNQAANSAKWTGTADGSVVKTDNWYWVGQVEITYQDTSDNREYEMTASVPEFQQFSDWYTVTAPAFDPNAHMGPPPPPPHGSISQQPPPTPGVPQPPLSTTHFATSLPDREAEKPRHGKHEQTALRAEQEVKPSHGKHEEKQSHEKREEKPSHGEHKPSHRAEE
jgi:hypothetical protein